MQLGCLHSYERSFLHVIGWARDTPPADISWCNFIREAEQKPNGEDAWAFEELWDKCCLDDYVYICSETYYFRPPVLRPPLSCDHNLMPFKLKRIHSCDTAIAIAIAIVKLSGNGPLCCILRPSVIYDQNSCLHTGIDR